MNLKKFQKVLILISIFWETFAICKNLNNATFDFTDFVILSSPIVAFWSIVWVYGFDAFKKIFTTIGKLYNSTLGNIFRNLMDYEKVSVSESLESQNSTYPLFVLKFIAFTLFAITGYIKMDSRDFAYSLGGAIYFLFVGVILFTISVISTCFIKDRKKRNNISSILFFVLSLLFCIIQYNIPRY